MNPKVQVSFEEVESLWARLREINAIPFADIEWTLGGKPVLVPPGVVEDWRFVGMSNASFVEFYDPMGAHLVGESTA